MNRSLATATLLAAFFLPLAASAQQTDDDDDAELDPLMQMMMSGKGIAQADLGEQDNGWFLSRENGVCRMYSFNDPLTIQADPSNPLNTQFKFSMIDRELAEAHGAQRQMIVAMRGDPEEEFGGYPAAATVSRDLKNYGYLMTVPLDQLVAKFPNGFQLVLMDQEQKPILQSDTLGSRKHLAALAQCGKGS